MIRTVSFDDLGGHRGPGIEIRDHFRKTPENFDTPHYCLGPLRTLAETTIDPGGGFPMHAHAEMEIVSYVRDGVLVHQDTLGNSGTLKAGDVQAMTTGTGILHSEVNGGDSQVRMYQVWIEPDERELAPSYVDLTDPKGAETGLELRLEKMGFRDPVSGRRGDQIVTLTVKPPRKPPSKRKNA